MYHAGCSARQILYIINVVVRVHNSVNTSMLEVYNTHNIYLKTVIKHNIGT